MLTLCLETSQTTASIALFAGRQASVRNTLPPGGRTARTLLPALVDLAAAEGIALRDVQRIAVASGPGSFTGLRIGVTAAKTLAYASGAELLGVNTLEVIARQAISACLDHAQRPTKLWTLLDAQRNQLFAASFFRDDSQPGGYRAASPVEIVDRAEWPAGLQQGEMVAGPPVASLGDCLPAGIIQAPESAWHPTAEGVGWVALPLFEAGRRDDPFQLVPNYFRASAAEEKRAAEQAPADEKAG